MSLKHDLYQGVSNLPFIRQTLAVYPKLPEPIAWEEEERRSRSLKRRFGAARIGRFKPLADYDWDWPRRCDRMAVEDLMTLDFLNEAADVVLVDPNGVGESTIAADIARFATAASHRLRQTADDDRMSALPSDRQHLLHRPIDSANFNKYCTGQFTNTGHVKITVMYWYPRQTSVF